ncbi:MAG: hypothetical protein SOV43_04670 [Selenomonadaceae bacterium]|nr:hypothetical protein [Selenomonadaceae bacterium]MDY2685446.1 hypothetical protein [Selenomonadaceae bacterium]
MNRNAKLFSTWLAMKKIQSFKQETLGDGRESVIFRTNVTVRGQVIPLAAIVDDSAYTIIRANLAAQALDDRNAFAVSQLITKLNQVNRVFKFYLAPDTTVLMDTCVPCLTGHFQPELVYQMIRIAAKELENIYSDFMGRIWG